MKPIHKNILIPVSRDLAFDLFINRLTNWWPKEYTWSQDKLEEMRIEPAIDGLCTEIGPFGFRCDWGRITSLRMNDSIGIKWQISPQRAPVPDPDQGSDITIHFTDAENATSVDLVHSNFEAHGDGYEAYAEAMDSYKGWSYILDCFKKFAALQPV